MDLFGERTQRIAAWALFGLALAYAFVAALRTVADFDVGWLLATGRYLVTHHEVPRTDVLSYTAYGVPWIYPPFGGALLYLVYTVGGFAALSWMNAVACVAVVAVSVGRPRFLTCALAILAVPSIAFRTAPRAELFTTFFFAVYLALLWKHRREGQAPLWLLPPIMLAWVNAHSGFSAGIALLGFYAAQELLELCFASRRLEAARRLQSAAPGSYSRFLQRQSIHGASESIGLCLRTTNLPSSRALWSASGRRCASRPPPSRARSNFAIRTAVTGGCWPLRVLQW